VGRAHRAEGAESRQSSGRNFDRSSRIERTSADLACRARSTAGAGRRSRDERVRDGPGAVRSRISLDRKPQRRGAGSDSAARSQVRARCRRAREPTRQRGGRKLGSVARSSTASTRCESACRAASCHVRASVPRAPESARACPTEGKQEPVRRACGCARCESQPCLARQQIAAPARIRPGERARRGAT